jgi:adenylate cyclase
MFTDMVGYTALGQKNEELSLALVEEQRSLVRPILARHRGREVKTMGDAFLVEFTNALDAVRCAYDVQRTSREYNISQSAASRVRLRVGVHLGDVEEAEGDILGDAVNVASRIEPLAEDGGVCLTRQVYDSVRDKVELSFASLGHRALKNVSFPVEVYRIVMPWEGQSQDRTGELDRKRVAVLPLTNMSPDPNDSYFADGMTEELISALSRVPGLKVISRTSVMQYKAQAKTATAVGRELNVGTLLEGSVRKAGTRIRITVQLIDANTDEHLWAENYDNTLDDIFDLQTDVASKVAGSLATKFFETPRLNDTDNVEAYTLYMRAMQLLHQGTKQSLRESIALFEKTISEDSSFVRAYAGLVAALSSLSSQNLENFETAVGRAEAIARRALEVGPDSAEAHAAMSSVNSQLDRFEEAISEAKKAVQINPNLSEVYSSLGTTYCAIGDLERGIENSARALELDPLSFQLGHSLCHVYLAAGRNGEALELSERLRRLHPGNPLGFHCLAHCSIRTGDHAKATELVEGGLLLDPESVVLLTDKGILYALAHERAKAVEQLRRVESNENESARLFGQVWIRATLGDLDEAFRALMRQAETHAWFTLVKTEPLFEGLRKDPRFAEFCRKVGLPP